MKQLLNRLFLLPLLLLAAGCTQNDGDIGRWFGFWRLESITVDSTTDDAYQGNITWAFQADIIEIDIMLPGHVRDNGYGTWSADPDGNAITINFTHTADNPSDVDLPAAMHLPWPGAYRLDIVADNGRAVTLATRADGHDITYRLVKVY